MKTQKSLMPKTILKNTRYIRSNSNNINISYQQRLEIQKRLQVTKPMNHIKTDNNCTLYPNLTERVENLIQRNLLSAKSQRDTNTKIKTSYLISRFRLKLSKSIEKYMNKQENQALIKIQSYKELDGQMLTPRQLMLEARNKSRNENYSVFFSKIKRIYSDHEDQYTTKTNTINNNNSQNRIFSQYISRHKNQIK